MKSYLNKWSLFFKAKFTNCYNLKLGSGCNLGKNLSKEVGLSQLVKHKDTDLYIYLVIISRIYVVHEEVHYWK